MGLPALELSHGGWRRAGFPSHTNTVPSYQSRVGGRDGKIGQEKQRPSKMGKDRPQLGGSVPARERRHSLAVWREN